MAMLGQDLRDFLEERRLLERVAALVRRWDGCPPASALDTVLSGVSGARTVLPSQRGRRRA